MIALVSADEMGEERARRKALHRGDEGDVLRSLRRRRGSIQNTAHVGEVEVVRSQTDPRLLGRRGPLTGGGREAGSRVSRAWGVGVGRGWLGSMSLGL